MLPPRTMADGRAQVCSVQASGSASACWSHDLAGWSSGAYMVCYTYRSHGGALVMWRPAHLLFNPPSPAVNRDGVLHLVIEPFVHWQPGDSRGGDDRENSWDVKTDRWSSERLKDRPTDREPLAYNEAKLVLNQSSTSVLPVTLSLHDTTLWRNR